MHYRSHPVALAWRDAKDAALFFEHVIPARIEEVGTQQPGEPEYDKVLNGLLPPALLQSETKSPTRLAPPVISYVANYLTTYPWILGIKTLPTGETMEERQRKNEPGLVRAFTTYIDAANVESVSVFGERLLPGNGGAEDEPSLVLSQLNLVDTDHLPWRQLLEFRQDKDSMRKLGQLRRFVYEQYDDKSADYVREDLERRIQEYGEVTKLWDFPTRASLYTIALTGGGAIGLADAIGVAFFGVPFGTALVGASAAIGSAALAIETRRREVHLKRDSHPLAYLIEARSLTRKPV